MVKHDVADHSVKLLTQRPVMAIAWIESSAERTVDHRLSPSPANRSVPAG